jgi:uncharacterized membrane protein YqjE
MQPAPAGTSHLLETSKRLARRLCTIGENRIELFMVELQEERERLFRAILLALGAAVFGLLAAITLTAGVVVLFWHCSPLAVLLSLTVLYAAAAALLYWRLNSLLLNWRSLSATLDQLQKDRAALRTFLQ